MKSDEFLDDDERITWADWALDEHLGLPFVYLYIRDTDNVRFSLIPYIMLLTPFIAWSWGIPSTIDSSDPCISLYEGCQCSSVSTN